jgi:NhaP-type Na+/H+ or K+/H+ antiporter
MLILGLPAAIIFGAIAGWMILGLSLGMALLLGVILAPTDAALAEPVLEAEDLPSRVRTAVNVESGLNDGLALPALFIAVALIEAESGLGVADVLILFGKQLGFGLLFGVGFGVLGALLVRKSMGSGWMSPAYENVTVVGLGLFTFGATQMVGGSGFVACFLAGLIFSARLRRSRVVFTEFAESEANTLVLVAFLLFGAGQVRRIFESPPALEIWVIAILSLVVIRPVAIVLSLIGRRLAMPTRVFFGWFGPRGLASIVFLLTAVEELGSIPAGLEEVAQAVMLTVFLSVVLHGVTAAPASKALARSLHRRGDQSSPEHDSIEESPTRSALRRRAHPKPSEITR